MKNYFILTLILFSVYVSPVNAATITSISLHDKSGSNVENYPLTFGIVLKQGDATNNIYLNNGSDIPTQTNVKRTWSDGSIRHCVVSAIIPTITANGSTTININTTGTGASTTPIDKTAMLETDIGATIDLTDLSGSGHSGTLQADLRTVLTSATLDYWLSGSVCSEVILKQALSNSLEAEWEVRFYSTGDIRISHVVNNVNADYRGNINYSVSISQGHSNPSQVYTRSSFQHNVNSRWHKVYWIGTAPPEVELHYNLNYLISTGHIIPYNTSIVVSEDSIASMKSQWDSSTNDIYEGTSYAGLARMYFPNTGGRPDIGLLPKWTAMYLLSFDNRMKELTLGHADLLANAPVHYRESNASMPFYGKIVSIDDRPTIWTTEYNLANGSSGGLPAAIGATTTNWTIDRAHQGSFNYIPYLITGEKFYLDELYFWAGYDLSACSSHADWGRNGSVGLIRDQVRGEAWAFRNIVHAASIAPDGSAEKTYFNEKIVNNIEQWEIDSVRYPTRIWGIDTYGAPQGMTADVKYITAPWMGDFVLIVLADALRLGYSTNQIISNFSSFVINRFSHPDFNWYNGDAYHFPAQLQDNSYVQTFAQASSLYTSQPTYFEPIGYAYSYRHIALAALSQVVDQYKGKEAYDWLLANFTAGTPDLEAQYEIDPTWAIIPLSGEGGYYAPTITGPSDFSATSASVEIEGTYTVDSDLPDQSVTVTWTLGESSGFCVAALGVFSCTVPVELGANNIVFAVTDSNSGTANDSITVTRTAPSSITSTSISHGVLRH